MRISFQLMVGILLGVIVCNAQNASEPIYKGPPPNRDGKISIHISESDPVVSFDNLIRFSDLIADCTVSEVLPSVALKDDDPRSIETHSLLSVQQVLLGKLPVGTQTIALAQAGGKLGRWNSKLQKIPWSRPVSVTWYS